MDIGKIKMDKGVLVITKSYYISYRDKSDRILTCSSSFSVNKNFKLQRRPSIEITKNGNERAAGLSFTPHNIPRPPNWMIVNRCIFHVFTWYWKSSNLIRERMANVISIIVDSKLCKMSYPSCISYSWMMFYWHKHQEKSIK